MSGILDSKFQNPSPQSQPQPIANVSLIGDGNDANKHRLYFGAGEDDYFNVAGTFDDASFLMETLECVVKSPKALEQIKSVPVEERPTLKSQMLSNGWGGFFCSGDNSIIVGKNCGNGFKTAGLFMHEFHHFKQSRVGNWMNVQTNLPDQMLVERMGEAAAEVANFQFLNDVRHLPEAKADFDMMMAYRPGFKDYIQAVDAGKDESECVLAGMRGYAANHYLADKYAKQYHTMPFSLEKDNKDLMDFKPSEHDGIEQMMNEMQIQSLFPSGDNVDETAYFKMVTTGLMSELPPDDKIKREMRSDNFAYISDSTYKLMKSAQDQCEACGSLTAKLSPEGRAVLAPHGLYRDGAAYEKSITPPPPPPMNENDVQMPPPIDGKVSPPPPVDENGKPLPPPMPSLQAKLAEMTPKHGLMSRLQVQTREKTDAPTQNAVVCELRQKGNSR